MAAAARTALGRTGEVAVVILLATLIEATLVSQISRAGALFPTTTTGGGVLASTTSTYRLGCCAVSLGVAGLVFPKRMQSLVPTVNSILTMIFCIMAVILFGAAAPAANWSNLALSSSSAAAAWSRLPQSIPTFLQLLVYAEILPTVCQLLHYNPRSIGMAISLGSLLPLGLEIGWAALGIALVPPPASLSSSPLPSSGTATAAAAAAATVATAVHDPVNILLKSGGPVQAPLLTLAITAIATTIIGCYLALQSLIDDVFPMSATASSSWSPSNSSRGNTDNVIPSHGQRSRRRGIWTTTAIVAPSLAIASISPNLFLQAIDFAGSYPVLLLWGVAPPVICLLQRRKQKQQQSTTLTPISSSFLLPIGWLWGATIVSLGLFAMSAAPDLAFLVRNLQKPFCCWRQV
jgi:amino acid permease